MEAGLGGDADLVEQLRLPGMCSCFGWDKERFSSGCMINPLFCSGDPHLQQTCWPGGTAAPAWHVLLLWLGQGKILIWLYIINPLFCTGNSHLQQTCWPGGTAAPAWHVFLLWLGQGKILLWVYIINPLSCSGDPHLQQTCWPGVTLACAPVLAGVRKDSPLAVYNKSVVLLRWFTSTTGMLTWWNSCACLACAPALAGIRKDSSLAW